MARKDKKESKKEQPQAAMAAAEGGKAAQVQPAEQTMAVVAAESGEAQPAKKPEGGSGSKPRPNVTYVLLDRAPNFAKRPQVAQLQRILYGNKLGPGGTFKAELTEPELFELVKAGKEAGVLRTKQTAVRIFQYYRSGMIKSDCIRMV